MQPLIFLGGVLTGAAGLAAAALWDDKKTESQYSPLLKNPNEMNTDQVEEQLNNYFFKAQGLYSECNKIVMESCDLIFTPIPLPDDNILRKAANLLGGGANRYCRSWRESELRDVQNQAKKLYDRYKGVFERANALVLENGGTAIDLNNLTFSGKDIQIDNSLDNDDWGLEFQSLADIIREFIENSCNAAEQLIDLLKPENKTETKPAICK